MRRSKDYIAALSATVQAYDFIGFLVARHHCLTRLIN